MESAKRLVVDEVGQQNCREFLLFNTSHIVGIQLEVWLHRLPPSQQSILNGANVCNFAIHANFWSFNSTDNMAPCMRMINFTWINKGHVSYQRVNPRINSAKMLLLLPLEFKYETGAFEAPCRKSGSGHGKAKVSISAIELNRNSFSELKQCIR